MSRTSGKIYIGVTVGTLEKRWGQHVSDASRGSKLKFHRAIRKYGPDDFDVDSLCVYPERESACHAEIEIISALNLSVTGYNSSLGGDRSPMLGRHHSEESKAKSSASHCGRLHTPETRARMSEIKRNVSDETRAKYAAALARRNRARTGQKASLATREKMRAAKLGKKRPPEVIEKMLATRRARQSVQAVAEW